MKTSTKVILGAAAILILGLAIYATTTGTGSVPTKAPVEPPPPPGTDTNGNDKSPDGPGAQIGNTPTAPREWPVPPDSRRPEQLGADILQQYHPVGQRRHILVEGHITGRGSNRNWGLQGNYHLTATSLNQIDWEVVKNDGREVHFKVHVPVSSILLFASERAYTLHPPDVSPALLKTLELLLDPTGVFTKQRERAWDVINIVDPKLERTTTALKTFLEQRGLAENEIRNLELKTRRIAQDVEGVTTTLVYVDGRGFTRRLELEGAQELDPDLVERIDRGLRRLQPALVAYFLFPIQTPPGSTKVATDVGDEWDVDASRVAGLFEAVLSHDVEGTVRVRRLQNEQDQVVLEIADGSVNYLDRADGRSVTVASVAIKSGTRLLLSPNGHGGYKIERGHIDGQSDVTRASRDHWLFEERLQAAPRVNIHVTGLDQQ